MNRKIAVIALFALCASTLGYFAWNGFEPELRAKSQMGAGSSRGADLSVKSKTQTEDISSMRSQGDSPTVEQKDTPLIGGTALCSDVDPSRRTPEERTAGIKIGLHNFFGRPVEGLELPLSEEGKLWKFLVERDEAAWIAHDVVKETHTGNPGDFVEMVDASRREVESDMEEAFDAQTFRKIRAMLDAESYIGLISHSYYDHFVEAGVPLSSKQYLSLATTMSEAYRTKESTDNLPPITTIDPETGLSPPDYQVIERVGNVMSAHQISALKNAMIELNKKRLRPNPN